MTGREPGSKGEWNAYNVYLGSDLHAYRGHEDFVEPFIMGHEAVGEIVALGKGVKGFDVGDMVIAPFSLSCGEIY